MFVMFEIWLNISYPNSLLFVVFLSVKVHFNIVK